MKVTIFSRDGSATETVEAEKVVPIWSHSNYMAVILEGPSGLAKIQGGDPDKYFVTNAPLHIEGVDATSRRQPEPTDQSFTVKQMDDAGNVINTWQGAQSVCLTLGVLEFKVGDVWHGVTGNVFYEPE